MITDAIEAREEDRALSLLDQHLRHIEGGVQFDDRPPLTGALSAALRPPGQT